MKKQILLLLIAMALVHCINAQSIVGTWKTISNMVINTDGSKTDITALQFKQWPCMADLHTVFDANGKQYMKSAKKCGSLDYSTLAASSWKMNGKTISIANTTMPTPLENTATYTVDFAKNKAVFTHEYSAEEKAKLHTPKVKKVVITYQRV